jgi:predicted metal-dependent phosphoesterase TrpH
MIDLHTHSTASDGTLSPSELVSQAAMAGVKTLALTDHDCITGIAEAKAAAKQHNIQLIPGIELSVMWSGRTLHLVGLNIDVDHCGLNDALQGVLEFRSRRAEEIARKLESYGVENALDGTRAMAKTELIGRSHFARYLVDQGFAKDFRQVFKRFLVNGKPGYVGGEWMPLATGIDLIHQAGGVAILAHPARYNLSRTKLRGLFKELKALGANGIEVVSGSHSKDENLTMAQHALDFELPASQGSDYHGPDKPWVKLGRLPPMHYRCTPIWEAGLDLI